MSVWITSELTAGSSNLGGTIIAFADKAEWLSDDPKGTLPTGATRDILIRTNVGESLPACLELSVVEDYAPAICWQGLRLVGKGRESGYNFWNDHNVLPLDVVVILTSTQPGRGELSPQDTATELLTIQK